MTLHRFCCPEAERDGDRVRISGGAAAQIRRVLRLGPGDQVILFGADEWEYTVQLERVERDGALGTVVARALPAAEPRCALTLAFACLKGEKTDWVIQKGTELGVARFLLLQSQRTVVTPDERRAAGRLERYARIAREATEQCGRLRPPRVEGVLSFEQALDEIHCIPGLILHERATDRLSQLLCTASTRPAHDGDEATAGTAGARPRSEHRAPNTAALLLFVGPEGGFTEEEVAQASARGAQPASLGPRVLRAETAALAAVTLAIEALDR